MAIGTNELARMLRAASDKVSGATEQLSRLDSVAGDGDHGTTMRRAMAAAEKAFAESQAPDLGGRLSDVSWALLGIDGGATGPLLGMLFQGMGESAGERETLDTAGLAEAFEAGLAAVRRQTRAQVGDKTVIDALVPAVEALRAAADEDASPAEAMARAADAAERGAESTAALQARFGRARNLGPRSIGSPDAGATSMSLIFRAFAEALAA